jgi:hypothetical protein
VRPRPAGSRLTASGFGLALVVALAAIHCGQSSNRATREQEVTAQRDAAAAAAQAEPEHPDVARDLRRQAPLSVADRAAWRKVLKWPAECEEAFEASHAGDDGGLVFAELSPRVTLVDVLCAAGGYQPSHIFLRLDERGSSRVVAVLEFTPFDSEDGRTVSRSAPHSELWGEAYIAADRRELSVLSLSRQLGDCGTWHKWAIGTEQPRLTAAAARLPCPSRPGTASQMIAGDAPSGWRRISPDK